MATDNSISKGLVTRNITDFTNGDWVNFLRIIENLGGSQALQRATERRPERPPFKDPKDFPNVVGANLNSASMLFTTYTTVTTLDGHTGSGWALGVGAGGEVTGGILGYSSWEELKSTPNAFAIGSVEEGVAASFFIDGNLVAVYVGSGLELDVDLSGGSFTWE
ncbi:hypothetical protein AJ80_03461 [Polytolypa hystricis UAMH7299]|uniref:Uncharacterized protein n=1 Tax=Polytolypa hystricis (strain UAMH7299) TaxID=1447883 RepID=A0A2B7Y9U0_POLH7|nr:hypothetical protein AJ80_03461 [Polytolypa hystricis UAMH7299]